MPFNLSFAGAAGTDLAAAGIGLNKLGTTGAFQLSGWGRAVRTGTAAVHYQHSETLTSGDVRITVAFRVDSLTIAERWGPTFRDTSTYNAGTQTTTRNALLWRIRTVGSSEGFLELYKIVNSAFTVIQSVPFTFTSQPGTNDANLYVFVIEVVGDQVTVKRNGVDVVTPYTITDSVLLNAGKIGLYASPNDPGGTGGASNLNGTGTHLETFSFEYVSAGADAELSGSIPEIDVVAPTAEFATTNDVDFQGAIPEILSEAPGANFSNGLDAYFDHDFDGCNTAASSTITNPGSANPQVVLQIRNPEQLTVMWQHARACIKNAAGRTIDFALDTATQEAGSGVYNAWSGPYWAPTLDDHTAWQPVSRTMDGTIIRWSVNAGVHDTIYVATMPPNTRSQVMSWIAALTAAHPNMVHDDLPSRVAAGYGPYTCDRAPTVTDEIGRVHSNEPMLGFRYADDSVGIPFQKHRIVLFAGMHPGEDHGFIQMRGFLDRWATDPALAQVRATTELWIYPIMATNGSRAGYRRFEPKPSYSGGGDINREWYSGTVHPTAQKWLAIMATDHGVNYDRVKAFIDFHDLSKSTQIIVYYYRGASTNLTGIRAVIDAQFPAALGVQSTSVDTATDHFQKQGVQPSITAEVSDQATSLDGFFNVGRGWASVVKGWYDAGLLGGTNVTMTGTALPEVTLTAPSSEFTLSGNGASFEGAIPEILLAAPDASFVADAPGVLFDGAIPEVMIEEPQASFSVGSAGSGASAEEVAAAVFARVVENGESFAEVVRLMRAVLMGRVSGAGTGTEQFLSADGTKARVTVTADDSGNRTSVTTDGT